MSRWPRLTERIEGELVVVEPLAGAHEGGLFAAGQDADTWRYLTAFPNACESRARFHRWMEDALAVAQYGREGTP